MTIVNEMTEKWVLEHREKSLSEVIALGQRVRGETLPVVFQIETDPAGAQEPVEVKSTFIVPRY